MSKIFIGIVVVAIIILIIKAITSIGFKATILLVGLIGFYVAFSSENYMREQAIHKEDIQHKASELEKLSAAPKEYERILNGITADNIVCWEDYLRNVDYIAVYVDDNHKVVRIITGRSEF